MKTVKCKGDIKIHDLREIAHNYKELSTLRDKSNILKMLAYVCSTVERISKYADRLGPYTPQNSHWVHRFKSCCVSVEWTVRIVRDKVSQSHTQFNSCIKEISYTRPKLLQFLSFFDCQLGKSDIEDAMRIIKNSVGYSSQNELEILEQLDKYKLNSSIQNCRDVLSDMQTDIENAKTALTAVNTFRLEWISKLECSLNTLENLDSMLNECTLQQDDKIKNELQHSTEECRKRLLKAQELVKLYADCSSNYLSNVESPEDMIVRKKTGRRK